ncbi:MULTISPECIES: aminoglycoside phosphotransferase family protein [unclassified Cryobacterium]|uniref:aminoglycoside phosphotransferase family protein n=1 Tax=unclassified Cryobacterium TaxID=2649013 RepID=UPI0014487074|nr:MULTISPECIES: aminoglycoside phosphotransferase family protein [unclassified Cryobacterium]
MDPQPFDQVAMAAYPDKSSWQTVAGELLLDTLSRWKLALAGSHEGGRAGIVVEVVQEDGTPAVLKIGVPHEEGRWEAVALAAFPKGTAPQLLRQDATTWALLLESVRPGTPLRDAGLDPMEALTIGGTLHGRIASSSPVRGSTLPRVSDFAASGALRMRDRIAREADLFERLEIEPEPLHRAADELLRLADLSTAGALVHGDFNPGNIVHSMDDDSERWMVIDPKGMVGDPAYDLWPLVTQLGDPLNDPDPAGRLSEQLMVAANAAGCDPRRTAEWAFARAGQVTVWFAEDGDYDLARNEARVQALWAEVLAG